MAAYFTHDNGGRPFLVGINPEDKSIEIFKLKVVNDVENYTELILKINDYKEIFVGEDDFTNNKGHSVLIKINPNKYIQICSDIFEFNTVDEISKYVAPIGNSDVVYDYALGDKYVYLLTEKKYFDNKYFDPYTLFYGHKIPSKKMNVKIIHKRI